MGRYRPSLRSLRACARPVSALRRAEPEARGPGRAARAGRGRAAAPHEQRALEHDGGDERGGGVAGQDGPQEQHGGEVGVVAERAVVADLPVQRHDDERQHHLVHDARAQELRVLEVARGAPLRGRARAPRSGLPCQEGAAAATPRETARGPRPARAGGHMLEASGAGRRAAPWPACGCPSTRGWWSPSAPPAPSAARPRPAPPRAKPLSAARAASHMQWRRAAAAARRAAARAGRAPGSRGRSAC